MTLTLKNAPIPAEDAIAQPKRSIFGRGPDPLEGRITPPWMDYFTVLATHANASPTRINAVRLTGQEAAIAATDFSGGALTAGAYRFHYYLAVTRAAGTSSNLQISVDWTESGLVKSVAGSAIVDGTTVSVQSGTVTMEVDNVSPVRYTIAYTSVGAPTLQYRVSLFLEQVFV